MDYSKYFDYASTYPLDKKIFKKCWKMKNKGIFGNPSSLHGDGILSKRILEEARVKISDVLKCKPSEIIFTSGGSECDNMALKGVMLKYKPGNAELITSTIEHPAILETCHQLERLGYKIYYVKPDKYGYIPLNKIKECITDRTKLISIMTVNNETGVKEDIFDIAKLAHENNILFHTDGVQSVGKVFSYPKEVDLISFSSHKFGGLKGTGFLYKKEGIELEPLICGGGQEFNQRSGTQNTFGDYITALCFCQYYNYIFSQKRRMKLLEVENIFWKTLEKEAKKNDMDIRLNFMRAGLINFSIKDVDSLIIQSALYFRYGFMVSTTSACHSNSDDPTPSYVLKEIGIDDEYIGGTLRISFIAESSIFQTKRLAKAIIKLATEQIRKRGK